NDRDELSTFATRLQDYLRKELKDRLSDEDLSLVVGASRLYQTWNVFICSFCADSDRNEHWHQYARRAGYAIGFDPNALRSLAHAQGFVLAPMIYGEDRAFNIATGVIQDQHSVWDSVKSPLSIEDKQKLTRLVCNLI